MLEERGLRFYEGLAPTLQHSTIPVFHRDDMKLSHSLILAVLCAGAHPSLTHAASKHPARVALLPLLDTNATARKAKRAEKLTQSLRFELTDRPEIALIEHEQIISAIAKLGAARRELEDPDTIRAVAKQLNAGFIVLGTCAHYGSLAEEVTYIDLRVFEGQAARPIGWPCERADKVDKPSMTISSAAMEQKERLGGSITVPIRLALAGAQDKTPRESALVLPFAETGEDTYAQAVSRMFATELMNRGPHLVQRRSGRPDTTERSTLLKWARENGLAHVFFGEVISSTADVSRLRASQVSVATGEVVRKAEQPFTSDVDLRLAVTSLAHRFAVGGKHILWRNAKFFGETLYTTPVFARGNVLVGVPGPAVTALDPFTGKEVWKFDRAPYVRSIGEHFCTPAIFQDTMCVRGPRGPAVYRRALSHNRPLPSGRFAARSDLRPLDLQVVADEELLLVPTGVFGLLAVEVGEDENLVARWEHRARGPVLLPVGHDPQRVVVASRTGRVSALNRSDGKPAWQRQLPDRVFAAPTVSSDRVFVGCENGQRLCIALGDGKILWSRAQKGRSLAAAALTGDAVCFADETGAVSAYEAASGQPRWSAQLTAAPQRALTAFRDLIYAACADGRVCCIDAKSGKVQWYVDLHSLVYSVPLVVSVEDLVSLEGDIAPWTESYDHAIFVTTEEGMIYALGGTSTD